MASGEASRSWLWGPQPGPQLEEDGPDGEPVEVQYFDKARMELNSAVTDPNSPWRVTTGLLVAEMVGLSGKSAGKPAALVVAGDQAEANPRYSDFYPKLLMEAYDSTGQVADMKMPGRGKPQGNVPTNVRYARFVAATHHNIPDVFWRYLNSDGPVEGAGGEIEVGQLFDWVYLMGYPISEPYWATLIIDGKPELTLVQLFQRRVLTFVPSFDVGWQVQMGNVGAAYHKWRYTDTQVGNPKAPAIPAVKSPGGGFVETSGDGFIYRGNAVTLKGSNYWLSAAPFADTWSEWNGPVALAELEKAHELGVNAIRIGIPYDNPNTMEAVWGNDDTMTAIGRRIKSRMTQLLQIASGYGMKVVFVLFDWYDDHPPANTPEERTNFIYVDGIVGAFASDDRVLAWDLSNEPDVTEEWKAGRQSDYVDWVKRMAIHVRQIDSNHPITVGVGDYHSLWYASDKGDTILGISDIVSFHCYDAGALAGQISEIKGHTGKPILLEEMGWPTSTGGETPRPGASFEEQTQSHLYTSMLKDAKNAAIAGVFQWTLFDFDEAKANLVGGYERFFGLFRRDGSAKPAAAIFGEDYSGPPLYSETRTDIPLDTSDRPGTPP